jgi:hypothetical protein
MKQLDILLKNIETKGKTISTNNNKNNNINVTVERRGLTTMDIIHNISAQTIKRIARFLENNRIRPLKSL